MNPVERRQRITNYLKTHKKAEISLLSEMLQVSEMTVRRDLDLLEKKNVLIRIHGGALLAISGSNVLSMNDRLNDQKEEKLAIGKYAASQVKPGEVISMDDSSTCLSMVPFLPSELTVITNCITVASALLPFENIDIVMLGGEFNRRTQSTAGKDMEKMLSNYHVNRAFISSTAMDPDSGLFDGMINIADTKRAFIKAASKTYYICDHTKLHTFAISKVCDLGDLSVIVMDACEDVRKEQQHLQTLCDKQGVELVLV